MHGKEHYIYAATDSFSAEFRPNHELQQINTKFEIVTFWFYRVNK